MVLKTVLLMEILANVNSTLVMSKSKTPGESTIVQLIYHKSNVLKSTLVNSAQELYYVLILLPSPNKNSPSLILTMMDKSILVITSTQNTWLN
jgi:hypothetical protein